MSKTVDQKIATGEYSNKVKYPSDPKDRCAYDSEYRKEEDRLIKEFFKDCFQEMNIPEDHPNAKELIHLSWDLGRSSGLAEVWFYFREFAVLLNPNKIVMSDKNLNLFLDELFVCRSSSVRKMNMNELFVCSKEIIEKINKGN